MNAKNAKTVSIPEGKSFVNNKRPPVIGAMVIPKYFPLNAVLDDLRIYDRPLTAKEIDTAATEEYVGH